MAVIFIFTFIAKREVHLYPRGNENKVFTHDNK